MLHAPHASPTPLPLQGALDSTIGLLRSGHPALLPPPQGQGEGQEAGRQAAEALQAAHARELWRMTGGLRQGAVTTHHSSHKCSPCIYQPALCTSSRRLDTRLGHRFHPSTPPHPTSSCCAPPTPTPPPAVSQFVERRLQALQDHTTAVLTQLWNQSAKGGKLQQLREVAAGGWAACWWGWCGVGWWWWRWLGVS